MIGLVACSSSKLDRPAPAAELYTSDLFRKSRAVAEARCSRWAILSAKHGVLLPDTVVAPYDVTLARMGVREREAWARRTHADLHRVFPRESFLVLAGVRYRAALDVGWCRECSYVPRRMLRHDAPLAGLGIGQQLAWLKAANEATAAGGITSATEEC